MHVSTYTYIYIYTPVCIYRWRDVCMYLEFLLSYARWPPRTPEYGCVNLSMKTWRMSTHQCAHVSSVVQTRSSRTTNIHLARFELATFSVLG